MRKSTCDMLVHLGICRGRISELIKGPFMGKLIIYIVVAAILLAGSKRTTRHVLLGYAGVIALIAGIVLLANAGSFLNFEAIRSTEDLGTAAKVLGPIVLVAIGGGIVLRRAVRGFISQKRFEWRVDRFHDAWNSRKDRWL